MKPCLPNLLVIGAMKAGSTALHDYLGQHPEINMSQPKELNFFSDATLYAKGKDWYSQFFDADKKYNGESSINYTKRHTFPGVPQHIKGLLGDSVKFIYIVRDPIERFTSNFTDSKTYGHIPADYSINKFVSMDLDTNPLLKTSLYFYQISYYLDFFALDNFCFLKAEDVKSHVQHEMDHLFKFLNMKPVNIRQKLLNKSDGKQYMDRKWAKYFQAGVLHKVKDILPNFIKKPVAGLILKQSGKTVSDDPGNFLSKENQDLLREYFSDDMAKFKALTGIGYERY